MADPLPPLDDAERLEALRRTGLLDGDPDPTLDRLTRLASRILQAPVSLVTLIDEDRQFFASQVGASEPWASRRESPLSYSLCKHVVAERDAMVIPDATKDERVCENDAVSELGVRAYVGVPLVTAEGHAIGSFCVMDGRPRDWSDDDLEILRDLAMAAMAEIELRMTVRALDEALGRIRTLRGLIPICTSCKNVRDDAGYWQRVEQFVTHHSDATFTHGLCPDCADEMYGDDVAGWERMHDPGGQGEAGGGLEEGPRGD